LLCDFVERCAVVLERCENVMKRRTRYDLDCEDLDPLLRDYY